MDQNSKCNHDIKPITQQPTPKDQSPTQKDQTEAETVLMTEHPAYLEAQSAVPKPQTVLVAKEQAVYSIDEQEEYSKEQPRYSKNLNVLTKNPTVTYSNDQPATYSKHQPPDSKIQSALMIDQPRVMAKEQSTYPKTHNVTKKHDTSSPEERKVLEIDSIKESSTSKEELNLTSILIGSKDGSDTSSELTIAPKVHIASTKSKQSLSKESSPENQTNLPAVKNKSTKDETYFLKNLNFLAWLHLQAAPTKNESANKKNLAVAPMKTYSGRQSPRNVESGISLCAPREISGTLSHDINKAFLRNSNAPLKINSFTQSPNSMEPASQSPGPTSTAVVNQPLSLFLLALSKLNDSSLALAVINHFKLQSSCNLNKVYNVASGEITPPDSLMSAPPTYSFVLRQIAIRRRPRLLGTFFPSPSFVQQTPPPTYTGAFDVYIEPALPPPPARVYTFGFTSMPIVCPECGYTGMTVVTSHVTICTHLCACILCLLCCWVCAPLPYILRSCKDVYHYCRNCRSFLGLYCPTNPPDAAYSNV